MEPWRTVCNSISQNPREQNVSGRFHQVTSGPSHGRTIHRTTSQRAQRQTCLCKKFELEGRTIRPKRPDHPPVMFCSKQRQTSLWTNLLSRGEPSAAPGLDPSVLQIFRSPETTMSLDKFFKDLRTVRPFGPDCPRQADSIHLKTSHHFLETLLALMHATKIFE